mmetsp:Transcript_18247/g.39199  ORF Transcript_18247/g.39199 Transcript_18247/m.39199 type:complete len:264 (+) Transcript_18247:666-1457(+)
MGLDEAPRRGCHHPLPAGLELACHHRNEVTMVRAATRARDGPLRPLLPPLLDVHVLQQDLQDAGWGRRHGGLRGGCLHHGRPPALLLLPVHVDGGRAAAARRTRPRQAQRRRAGWAFGDHDHQGVNPNVRVGLSAGLALARVHSNEWGVILQSGVAGVDDLVPRVRVHLLANDSGRRRCLALAPPPPVRRSLSGFERLVVFVHASVRSSRGWCVQTAGASMRACAGLRKGPIVILIRGRGAGAGNASFLVLFGIAPYFTKSGQ